MSVVEVDTKVIITAAAGVFVALALAAVFLLGLGSTFRLPDLSAWGSGILVFLIAVAVVIVLVIVLAYARQE